MNSGNCRTGKLPNFASEKQFLPIKFYQKQQFNQTVILKNK